MNHEYIAVIGTMGSGKSTASELIAKELNFAFFDEQFKTNPYLEKYYKEPARYAYFSQTFFLTEIYRQTIEAQKKRQVMSVVQDSHMEQYRNSYVPAQVKLGYMEPREYDQYLKLYEAYKDTVEDPSLFVYLHGSIPVLMDRIAKRDRSCERKIEQKYVELLDQLNHEWLAGKKSAPVLFIETDHMDIVRDPVAKKHMVVLVQQQLHL